MGKKQWILVLSGIVMVSLLVLSLLPQQSGKKLSGEKKLAVIYIDGVISSKRSAENFLSDGNGGTGALIQQLHKAANDPEIGAIILRINSPGGSSTAAEELGTEIKKVRAQGKVVVTSMGDIAASAGYWLAAGTDKIYANASTLTGSIGVYMPYSNWEELYKKIGIRQEKIKSGPHKDILANDRPMTEEERALLQNIVNEIYEDFVQAVAEGRKLDPAAVRLLADGRVFTGKQALQVGLVDEIGNLQDAIDGTAALIGLQGKPVVEEIGNDNPLQAIFSTKSQLARFRDLLHLQLGENQVQADMPLLLPEK